MIDTRLAIALDAGLTLPSSGGVVAFQTPQTADLPMLSPADTTVVHPFKPDHDRWQAAGFLAAPEPPKTERFQAALVSVPRAKVEAFALIASAVAISDGVIVVDGQKTDGIDSVLKAVKARVDVGGVVSKAHGKLFWFENPGISAFEGWQAGPALTAGGFWTAPGVFSADGIDPASALLADALPDELKGTGADLGAGWGFLTAHVLVREDVRAVHCVEAHHMALACAEHNVTDPRARFHWADAVRWAPDAPLDFVVMNPPFHAGRAAEPAIGQAFIRAAANMLAPAGTLWMVANRHLPYEPVLAECFAKTVDLGGDARFKLVMAERPLKGRAPRSSGKGGRA